MLKTILLLVALHTCTIDSENYVLDNVGFLHLSEQKWRIQHVLNLTEYKETSILLKECVNSLNVVCENSQNEFCSYFQHATKNLNVEIDTDISKLNTLLRKKRFIFIPIILGVTVVGFWAGIILAKSTLVSMKLEIERNLDLIEETANLSIAAINMQEKLIKDLDEKLHILESTVNDNTQNLKLFSKFHGIINVVLFSAHLHEKMQTKLNHIYSGELRTRLFEVIDYGNFLIILKRINEQLKPNLQLPKIDSMGKNTFIDAYTEFNTTHLTVSVELPVIRTSKFLMSELIPIPILENNKLFILDMNTIRFYRNDSQYQTFSIETQNSLCKTQDRVTICNTFLDESTEKPGICLHNLLTQFSDAECTYKEIPYKNYFIRISKSYLYAFIVKPVKILKSCRGNNDVINLSESIRIFVPNECEIYKYSESFHYKGEKTSKVDITPENIHMYVNLSLPEINKQLSSIPLWDKYQLQFIEGKGRIKRLQKAIPLQREQIQTVQFKNDTKLADFLPDFGLKDYLTNKIVYALTLCVIIILLLLILKCLIIKCLTNWGKKVTPSHNNSTDEQ